ncbi:MAG: hypothetical protein JWN03_1054 [Nocardia sp.]|uniref:DUF6286 domain-containing protein n=1 Tax=Nocardia sp. TaxID=1821 RepID=UPI0026391B39|nr:DUF6286 domain-containing protein [Nocardia sp.]MCU1640779.1 hypothetical protein [Nocardia sp.]
MIRRPRRVGPAVVVALAVLALCVLTAVSLIGRLLGRSEVVSYDSIAHRLHDTRWSDGLVLGAGVAVVVVGAVLLVLALLPGRPVVVALDEVDGSSAGVSRRSLRAALRREAGAVHGVDSARVRLGSKKILVSARTGRTGSSEVDGAVQEAVTRMLERIAPARPATVRTRLRSTSKGENR